MISVVLVSLNAESVISSAISSILSLKILNLELIVVDGLSTDGTLHILKTYSVLVEEGFYGRKKMKFLSEKDSGIYDAMNKGVRIASNDWVYFIGADDIVMPKFQEIVSLLLDKNKVYYFDCLIMSTGKLSCGKFDTYKLSYKNICHQAIVYPRHLLLNSPYNTDYKIVADYFLNIMLWSNPLVKFRYTPLVIAAFAGSGISASCIDAAFYDNQYSLIKNELGLKYAIWSRFVLFLHRLSVLFSK